MLVRRRGPGVLTHNRQLCCRTPLSRDPPVPAMFADWNQAVGSIVKMPLNA